MPAKTLTIESITFPKFSKNSSKRNFRLVFYIVYKDAAGKTKTTIVTKPAEGQWQWKKSEKEFFFPEKQDFGDSIELDASVLTTGENGFAADDNVIAEVEGEIQTVAVQFVDVFDSSIADFLRNTVFQKFVGALKTAGFSPLDLLPVPGVVTGLIKENVKIDKFVEKADDFITKETKDKLLHRLSQKYNGENSITLSGKKEWDENKTGTYAVSIGIE
jgi:hypothetical protein